MSSARDDILGRIRRAVSDVPQSERPDDVAVARAYRTRADADLPSRLERFAKRIRDYHADFRRVAPTDIAQAVSEACAERGLKRVVVPGELPSKWRPHGVEVVEDAGLSARELDAIDAAITGCAVAIAETGTLALDGRGACGRRIITLVPDHHICVVRADQVAGLVPEAVSALARSVIDEAAPVTLISGPSASSDIELERVEGVHGPRHLMVFLAAD